MIPETFKSDYNNMTNEELCKLYNVGYHTIWRWAKTLNIYTKKPIAKRRDTLEIPKDFIEKFDTMSIKELSSNYNVSASTIYKWQKHVNLFKKSSINGIYKNFKEDYMRMTMKELSSKYGVSYHTIWYWSRKLGVYKFNRKK